MSDALFNRLFKKMKNTNVGHLEVGVKTLSQAQPGENASPWEGYTSTFLTFSSLSFYSLASSKQEYVGKYLL